MEHAIKDVDQVLGREFLVFGGATVRVDCHFPKTERFEESVAIRCLDSLDRELVQISAETWNELRAKGAIVDA